MADGKPHILFVMADQLGAPVLPCYGHPVVKAPHLDALANRGVVFDNAYCNVPLCAPSRASLLAGRLGTELGAYDNASPFPSEIPTFAHCLRALGYRTALSGKMHLVGADQLHGFEERLTTDFYPADFGWTANWDEPEKKLPFFHVMESVTEAGPAARSMPIDFDDEAAFQAERAIFDAARDPDGRPLFLVCSFTHPHDPYATTRAYWERYTDDEIDLPAVPPIPVEERDPHSRRLYDHIGMDRTPVGDDDVRRARRAYYGMVSYVDDKLGMLMGALERAGLADDTVVIFAADHGDMLGERGMWYKMTFHEWSARVPLVVHDPREPGGGRRVGENVSLVDLFPTLVDLASDAPPDPALPLHLDGRSLRPLMRGEAGDWPDTVYAEYLGEGAHGPCLMVRRGRYKYMYSEGDPARLFDLEADPRELDDLAGRPELERVERDLQALIAERWPLETLKETVIEDQRRRRFVFEALRQGAVTPWDHSPCPDASKQYIRNDAVLAEREARARLPEQS